MNRLIFLILCFIAPLFSQSWRYQYQFELKKDQVAKVKISFRDKNIFLRDGVFTFRWTLYKTGALITFSEYQKVKSQHVLYKDFRLNSFGLDLVPKGKNINDRVYLSVEFVDFDKKRDIAKIDMFIRDDNNKILVDFIDPNKESYVKKSR